MSGTTADPDLFLLVRAQRQVGQAIDTDARLASARASGQDGPHAVNVTLSKRCTNPPHVGLREILMVGLRQLLQSRESGEEGSCAATTSNNDRLMMFLQKSIGVPEPVQPQQPAQPQPPLEPQLQALDADAAVDLLDSAELTFDVLVSRFHQLEAQMAERAERAKAESRAVEEMKKLTMGIQIRAEQTDRHLEEMKVFSAAAEVHAATAEARVATLQEAYDVVKRQGAAAEDLVTEFERVIAAFRGSKQAQRRMVTCGKCGLIAEISDFPGGRRTLTVSPDRMREACVDPSSFQKDCKYLHEAIRATLAQGDMQTSLVAALA